MISDAELLEWIKTEYGEKYANEKFLKMAKKIYEEKVLGKKTINEYKKVKMIEDIKIAGKYEIEGVILDMKVSEYIGCPKCMQSEQKGHKSDCDYDEFVEMVVVDGIISDGASAKFKYFIPKHKFNFKNFDEVRMCGYVKPIKDGEEYQIYIDRVIINEPSESIQSLLKRVKSMDGQRIHKKMLARYCKENNMEINDVLKYLNKEGDYYRYK
jgi:hypothetical protein